MRQISSGERPPNSLADYTSEQESGIDPWEAKISG
jgi:hypothetical protein